MFYVGLDIHKSHITVCVLDSNGKVFQRWQVSDSAELMTRLKELPPFEVCYEAAPGTGGSTSCSKLSRLRSRWLIRGCCG